MEIGGGDRNGRHGWPARSRRQGDFGTHQEGCQGSRIDRSRSGDFTRPRSWPALVCGPSALAWLRSDPQIGVVMAGLPITSSVIVSKALDLETDAVTATWHSL